MGTYRGSDEGGGSSGTHLCASVGKWGSDEGGGSSDPHLEVPGEGRDLNFGGSDFGRPRCDGGGSSDPPWGGVR